MPSIYDMAQNDGMTHNGGAVTNYTVKPSIAPQPQVTNKTPMHSRTQPETYSLKKK